jgi:hydroxyacylglutathione hydrolase
MREIAKDVYQISGFPQHMINMYLVGDVLIDAGIRGDLPRLLRLLRGRNIRAHALTHVHPDHQGASHGVCDALNIPLWCSEGEIGAMESGDLSAQIPANALTWLQERFWTGAAHPVAKGLREGDLVHDFTVIETPGHSPGHLSYWRERDRTLIVGDVARNIDFLTLQPGLAEPPALFTMDAARNRQSLRRLAELHPRVVAFGHGAPMLDGARFVEFAM